MSQRALSFWPPFIDYPTKGSFSTENKGLNMLTFQVSIWVVFLSWSQCDWINYDHFNGKEWKLELNKRFINHSSRETKKRMNKWTKEGGGIAAVAVVAAALALSHKTRHMTEHVTCFCLLVLRSWSFHDARQDVTCVTVLLLLLFLVKSFCQTLLCSHRQRWWSWCCSAGKSGRVVLISLCSHSHCNVCNRSL